VTLDGFTAFGFVFSKFSAAGGSGVKYMSSENALSFVAKNKLG
jgi:hypothetical protein